ncbi:hypothetical protein HQ393_05010 [Chitinibacter bivalviorum]|uniref:Uncharacterized protein n=1 Tax=Chitinibacter bivalviorum TaxID=2739434 RepID=A0A7H9BJD5_9NEIS|nr:hypothetical protein [Chitinibacter bivalviorum]QLG87664.1 hypothetical protein HQ393_05010 [Chitinibacter bivalviorum]
MTFDDVVRFMTQKGFDLKCACCQSDEWTLYRGDGESNTPFAFSSVKLTPTGEPLATGRFFYPVLVAECVNCGFLRQYNYKRVQKWVDENPYPPVKDNELPA